jgi:hypothetical protein
MAIFVTGAAPGGAAPKRATVIPQSTGCLKTFTNPGPPSLSVCVSGNGNINQITYKARGTPVTHIGPSEGYCLKDLNTGTTYHDTGPVEGGWGSAAFSATATTMAVTRTTTDGRFTLTQNIAFKYGSRMVVISNVLKNNDTTSHGVTFDRVFDGDIDGTSANDIYETTGTSELAGENSGLMLTALAPSLAYSIGAETAATFASTRSLCAYAWEPRRTAPGDYVGIIQHATTVLAGASVNFKVAYRLT